MTNDEIAKIVSAIFNVEIEKGWTFIKLVRLFSAVLGGKALVNGNVTKFRNLVDDTDYVTSLSGEGYDRKLIQYSIPDTGVFSIEKTLNALYSEVIMIPGLTANTDTEVTVTNIKSVVDIKYIFPSDVNNLIRVNKALVSGNKITFNFSLAITETKIIVIGLLE